MRKRFYIYRNFTVEPIFHTIEECDFSGYGDTNYLSGYNYYVWFYQCPISPDSIKVAEEVSFYSKKLKHILNQIGKSDTILCFTMSPYSSSTDSSDRKLHDAIESYNSALYGMSEQNKNIKIIDYNSFIGRHEFSDLIDYRHYYMSQVLPNPKLAEGFASWFEQEIRAIEGIRKKCLIVDLDNTLWGGVLGEDELSGIKLGNAYPGNCYSYIQAYLKRMKEEGVILSICSKNNLDDVDEVFEKHDSMILNISDFAVTKANWKNKVDNIKDIASDLNIGLDSMVFIDDSPFEREQVQTILPEVVVPDFPNQPYDIPKFIENIYTEYFRVYELTDEDKRKTEQYLQNKKRDSFNILSGSFNDLIAEMNIQLTITINNTQHCLRISQMTQKTNQFNLTTQRYNESVIKKMFTDDRYIVFDGSVTDKFGDSGITALAIVEVIGNIAKIDTLLLSCRILGRTIEFAFLNHIISNLFEEHDITSVEAIYLPTAKNGQVIDFMKKTQFVQSNEKANTNIHFTLQKRDFVLPDDSITVEIKS